MKKPFKSFISLSAKSTLLGVVWGSPAPQALANDSIEKTPQVRYVLTTRHYHKKITNNQATSSLLPRRIDSEYSGPFDLRNGIFHVAADIYLGRNKAVNEITGAESIHEDRLAILVMKLDENSVVSPHGATSFKTKAMTDSKNRLIAISTRGKMKKSYEIAHWLTIPTPESSRFTPTLCDSLEMPFEENKKNRDYRYRTKTNPEQYTRGTFGCREWAYQLYDTKRPYIDVTSYLRMPSIYGFIGWARKGDKKPVIGLEQDTWICLHDCPNGKPPGVISDIHAWAREHGWETPQRSEKIPMFPDPIQ